MKIKEYYKMYPWKKHLVTLKGRCVNKNNPFYYRYGGRGIKALISKEEIKELWFRDKAYLMEFPTIDRKDNNGHYTFQNCQFIENVKNIFKSLSKAIIQYDLKGNLIREWNSITEAETTLRLSIGGISKVLNGKRKSAYNFIWKFKL
mgnify:CR=1 FL=1